MQNKLKKDFITGVLCFLAVFGVLLAVATVFDLTISKALTGALPAGKYYTQSQFALFIEATGYSLIYIFGGLGAVMCCAAALNISKGDHILFARKLSGSGCTAVKSVPAIGFGVFAVFEFYSAFHEFFDYPNRFLQESLLGTDTEASINGSYLTAIQLFCALASAAALLLIFCRAKKETLNKLVRLAMVIFLAVIFYSIVIEAIKAPVGRMRYRTMNVIGDFSYYTPWYVLSGRRYLSSDLEVVTGSLESAKRFLGLGDTFKSFPSGHTYAAAISFAAVCLPDLFQSFRTKAARLLCWLLPAALTVTVAVGRIMAGAHFFSDVLVGGSFAFLITALAREVIILKCVHFKAFLRK